MSSDQGDARFPRWPNWLGVVVENLEEQRRFYGDVLGLAEMDAGEDWVQFDMGGPNMFELLRRSDEPQYDHPRFQPGFAATDRARGGGDHGDRGRPRIRWVLVLLPRPGGERIRAQSATDLRPF